MQLEMLRFYMPLTVTTSEKPDSWIFTLIPILFLQGMLELFIFWTLVADVIQRVDPCVFTSQPPAVRSFVSVCAVGAL